MSKLLKSWRFVPVEQELRDYLSSRLGISAVVAQVLINRGIDNEKDARHFLYAGVETLGDPYALKDMDKAVERITAAIAKEEKITVYGDYDVDGITACSILYKVLIRLGAKVEYYIPERQSEGYGLNHSALEQICKTGTTLIITVDCGISSLEETAAMLGKLDIIITDHHQAPEILPPALAIINPKRPGCSYPDKHLAGVGVVFKLCQALMATKQEGGSLFQDYLDMVAVGTIADIVPLIGENRLLVKFGLEKLARTDNLGLKYLLEICCPKNIRLDAGKVGFGLAPRLNAAGRVGHAAMAVELLTTDNPEKAKQLAKILDEENSYRQTLEKQIFEAADLEISRAGLTNDKVLVVVGDNWHPGVIGIVASRLVDKYYRPTIVISMKDGIGKGSCRSISGFDMYGALASCSDLITKYGGHKQAAGLTIPMEKVSEFRRKICERADLLSDDDYKPVLNIDTLVSLEQINTVLLEQLACLAPHGMGNPTPVFACKGLRVQDLRSVGQDGRHLKLRVRRQQSSGDVIAWGMGELASTLHRDENIDLAFAPELNEWQGHRNIQLKAFDLRKTID
jgi:single-stranded-DNA-specific exonuclease